MSGKQHLRKRLFVDPKVQGALMIRVVCYWMICLVTVSLMLLCWRIITGPARLFYTHLDDMWFHYGPAMVASLVLLPLVMVDIVRLSNRFAGPMLRLRRTMQQVARGEHVEPISFRDGDFWQEFAQDFNALLARINRLQTAVAQGSQPEDTRAMPLDTQREPVGAAANEQ